MLKGPISLLAVVALPFGHRPTLFAQQAVRDPQIEVRHARETAAPGFVYMEFAFPNLASHSMRGLYVENRAILLTNDFKEISASRPAPTELMLTLVLTPEAAARMVQETESKMGEYLATLIGPRLVSASRLMSVVGKYPDIPIFMGLRLPEDVAAETAERIVQRRRPQ